MRKKYLIMIILSGFLAAGCSTRHNNTGVPMSYDQLSARLSEVKIKKTDGEEMALSSLWADRRVVLTFLRHFG